MEGSDILKIIEEGLGLVVENWGGSYSFVLSVGIMGSPPKRSGAHVVLMSPAVSLLSFN